MRSSAGFTLIELVVTIAIISIVASVAVPHFVDARTLINEGHARADLVQISQAQRDFKELDLDGDGVADYARSLEELSSFAELDATLETGESHGYRFEVRSRDPLAWRARAVPVEPCVTGNIAMTIDQTGAITEEPADGPACRHDEVGKDSDRVSLERLHRLTRSDVAGALDRLLKDNPNLTGIVLAAMDRNQDGAVTIDEVMKGDYLAMARSIKGKLVFPKEWDAGGEGKDEQVVKIVDKFVDGLGKHLKLGIGNEGAPPPILEPQEQVPNAPP